MASMVFKYGAKKMMKGNKEKSSKKSGDSETDPYHYVNRRTGKKRRKDCEYFMSCGIPEEDARLLAKIKHRAMLLDGGGKVAGITLPVGIGGAIGFIPVVGDAIDGALAYLLIVKSARKISGGLDSMAHKKMMGNVTFDIAIGFVPVLGDLADILYKCNTRNANMLENLLKKRVAVLEEAGEKIRSSGARHQGRYDGVTLEEAARLEQGPDSDDSPHGSTRRQYAPSEPAVSERRGGASGFSDNGSRRHGAPHDQAAPRRPNRREGNRDAGRQGGNFIDPRDPRLR